MRKIKKIANKNHGISAILVVLIMIAFGIAWELILNPIKPGGSMLWVKVLPLVFALPGLYNSRVYTFQWLSLLVWFYVCEALVRVYTNQKIEIFLSIGWLLLSLTLFIVIWRAIKATKDQKIDS